MISTNEFCTDAKPICYSNWSQPLIYNIPVIEITLTESHSVSQTVPLLSSIQSNNPSSLPPTKGTYTHDYTLPVYSAIFLILHNTIVPRSPSISQQILWPLTGVIVGLFVLVVTLMTFVICCCCFGGRLMKRNMPMGPMIKMNPDNVDFEKQLYISCLELEEWEIPRNLLDVFENEVLGSGCFGEVCKGSLQMDYVHKKRRLNHQHDIHQKVLKFKDWLPVAVKKLKSM